MAESRFERWSRLKAEARQEGLNLPEAPAEDGLSPEEKSAAEDELAINEALPEEELLAKYGLPDPSEIVLGTDVTGFMKKEIPELIRRKALRALWRSNPVLAVLDGLNDYDEDYTDAAYIGTTVNTIYKVGEGMFKKIKPFDDSEESVSSVRKPNSEIEPVESPVVAKTAEDDLLSEPENEEETIDEIVLSPSEHDASPVTQAGPIVKTATAVADYVSLEEVPEPQLRFKPRMTFKT